MKTMLMTSGLVTAGMVVAATPAAAQIPPTRDNLGVSPPWQEGRNNDAPARGFQFTVPDADNHADFHGSPLDPAHALYVGGNYRSDARRVGKECVSTSSDRGSPYNY